MSPNSTYPKDYIQAINETFVSQNLWLQVETIDTVSGPPFGGGMGAKAGEF